MEVVIPLAMLAIGLIIGFFVARFMYTKEGAVKANEAAEKAIKELLSQQSQHHIFQVKQSIAYKKNTITSLLIISVRLSLNEIRDGQFSSILG